jgi:hypothetical protein
MIAVTTSRNSSPHRTRICCYRPPNSPCALALASPWLGLSWNYCCLSICVPQLFLADLRAAVPAMDPLDVADSHSFRIDATEHELKHEHNAARVFKSIIRIIAASAS